MRHNMLPGGTPRVTLRPCTEIAYLHWRPGEFGLPVRLPARVLVLQGQGITYFPCRRACHSAAVISHISDRRRPET
jgi:hypothetical protein